MKILSTFDRAVTETLQRDVRSKLHFKVNLSHLVLLRVNSVANPAS